jgi:hypothetical protein
MRKVKNQSIIKRNARVMIGEEKTKARLKVEVPARFETTSEDNLISERDGSDLETFVPGLRDISALLPSYGRS